MSTLRERLATATAVQRLRGRYLDRVADRDASAIVLAYHGIVEERADPRLERNFHTLREFGRQVSELGRYDVVPLTGVLDWMHGRRTGPVVAITFDDGYANNLLAAEVLAEAGMPWTIFPTTGVIGTGTTIWTVELSLLLLHGEAGAIEALEKRWPLSSREERDASFDAIRMHCKRLDREHRLSTLDQIRAQFPEGESARLLERFPSLKLMDWSQIQELARGGVEVGSHGVDHEVQHQDQPREVLEDEAVGSRRLLEERAGVVPTSFAYPNGDWTSLATDVLERAGYEVAVTMAEAAVTQDATALALPRLTAPGTLRSLAGILRANQRP